MCFTWSKKEIVRVLDAVPGGTRFCSLCVCDRRNDGDFYNNEFDGETLIWTHTVTHAARTVPAAAAPLIHEQQGKSSSGGAPGEEFTQTHKKS